MILRYRRPVEICQDTLVRLEAVLVSEIAHDILTVSAQTRPHRTVGNVSACRCVSDCKARGCQ